MVRFSLIALWGYGICAPGVHSADLRPNVVLIMTDDQGYGDFSCLGNPVLETPHLDKLAAESIRLTNFHVAPSCTPTRGQLLTGLDALRNGASSPTGQRFLLKRGIPTMGDIFRQHGYRTALYGKWHLGGNFRDFKPHERGFDDAVYFLRGGVQSHPNYWNSDLFDDYLYHKEELVQYPGYATDVWFDLADQFVSSCQESGEPFFLYLPLNAPHGPLLVPDHYRAPYLHLDKETATFFGMIASVDERLGKFLARLQQQNLQGNTIVVFLTDNGTANGEKIWNAGMRGKKGSLYEGGHRVPCWIRWPSGNLRPATDLDALAQCQDLLPTLCDLCKLASDSLSPLDGLSLAPLLRGLAQPELEDRVLVVQNSPEAGKGVVMQGHWRLVDGQLYDLVRDPAQTQDLSLQRADMKQRLTEHYNAWWSGVKDELELEPYRIGAEPETKLTAYDWYYGRPVFNWPHLRKGDRSNGKYTIVMDRAGRYRVTLRRWPRESNLAIRSAVERFVPTDSFMAYDDDMAPFPPGPGLDIVSVRVKFGNVVQRLDVESDAEEVSMEFDVDATADELQTWFITADGEEFGANYVYIEPLYRN
jgi:arylsulfatase A-like enzyme